MELLPNETMKAAIASYLEDPRIDTITRSRAIILRLNVDDELRVRVPSGHGIYGYTFSSGTILVHSMFLGIRLASQLEIYQFVNTILSLSTRTTIVGRITLIYFEELVIFAL